MNKLPAAPGPHKVDVNEYGSELFEFHKTMMAATKYLYQFKSFDEYIKCLTVDHQCENYIWNNEEGQMVGYFSHFTPPTPKNTDELLIIVTHPKFQGKGYGKKMIQFYWTLLKDKKKSILFTREDNTDAIRFYESVGYKIGKNFPDKYGDGATRILLEKTLARGLK